MAVGDADAPLWAGLALAPPTALPWRPESQPAGLSLPAGSGVPGAPMALGAAAAGVDLLRLPHAGPTVDCLGAGGAPPELALARGGGPRRCGRSQAQPCSALCAALIAVRARRRRAPRAAPR